MANGIRTGDHHGFNKGRSLKFPEGSRVRQTSEEGRRTYRAKRCGNNNKDEDNSPKNLNDKNQQASSKKFRQLRTKMVIQKTYQNNTKRQSRRTKLSEKKRNRAGEIIYHQKWEYEWMGG